MEKLNLTQQKHTFTNQKTITQNKHKKLQKPRFIAFYDIQPGNAPGLFSRDKISKGGDE